MTVAINYYLISFLAVTFKHPYMEVLFSTLAEILAYLVSGTMYKQFGIKVSMSASLVISAIGGYSVLIKESISDE